MSLVTPPLVEHEHKFVVDRVQAEAFLAQAADHLTLDVYDRARPVAYTRTTYLDTDELDYHRSCGGKLATRLRVRQYLAASDVHAPAVLTPHCYLELKQSAGARRAKARVPLPPDAVAAICARRRVPQAWWAAALAHARDDALRPVLWQLAARQLAPRLTTWYRRASLRGDGVRVTLDEGIRYCHLDCQGIIGATLAPQDAVDRAPGRLLEVKMQGASPAWLEPLLRPLVEADYSKFQQGMTALARAATPPRVTQTRPIDIPVLRG